MFIDEAKIRVKAGDGGNGCMAFRREKFVPRGGPSGGDGGRGGDVVMESSQRHNTLIHFRYNPEHKAQRGEHGMGSNCTGLDGRSITLQVPVGTSLYDAETGELVHDFQEPDERLVVAKGGRGGRGNQHFATSTHQAPREHELGRHGEERSFRLELKLLADVGLVGYPNAGKSTLIARISAARPKIADYLFTTLEPNLGVVTVGEEPDQESFVVADMPGLIEGAHLGQGLGTQFLRHIERTRLLLHLVDVSDASGRPDPVEDFRVINNELASFTTGAGEHPLADKPMIVAATKIDAANPAKLKKLAAYAKRRKLEFHAISAVTGEGIEALKWALAARLRPEGVARAHSAPKKAARPARKASNRATRKAATPPARKTSSRPASKASSRSAKKASISAGRKAATRSARKAPSHSARRASTGSTAAARRAGK
jgi:GTP-binding protein